MSLSFGNIFEKKKEANFIFAETLKVVLKKVPVLYGDKFVSKYSFTFHPLNQVHNYQQTNSFTARTTANIVHKP